MNGAQRIVCLTEETTETLYLLGESHRIVGISGYTIRAGVNVLVTKAIGDNELHEIPSSDLLPPGPAALTDGLRQIAGIIRTWSERHA